MQTKTSNRVTYVVLGGNGFIGSHIVDKLASRQNTLVRVVDSFSKPQQYKHSDNITNIIGSAFDSKILNRSLLGADYVIYAVGASNPFVSDRNPYIDIENTQKIVGIFEQCSQMNVKKVAFISSGGAVYGRIAEQKMASEIDMPMPVSPYGICKLATEHYLEYFKQKHGTEYVIYRLSNPYGPRQPFSKEHGVIASFFHAILEGREITVYGDGTSSRDYIYIEDAAQILTDTLLQDAKHNIYNLGSGEQTMLNDIINNLESILGIKAKVKYVEAPPTTLKSTSINIERIKNEFGLNQLTSFTNGLKLTLKKQMVIDLNLVA